MMKMVFFGTSSFAIPSLRALVAHGYPVVMVITQPDRPAGRGGRMTPPPVKLEAERLGLPVLQPVSCREPAVLDMLALLAPDLGVVAAYGQFLPDALRLLPTHGSVNLHGSLLPRYRGAAPIQRAIWQGDAQTGVCLMWMARAMDAGDVIDCRETPIAPEDTAGTLTERLAALGADLLLAWLSAIAAGTAPHHPQDPDQVTFAPAITKEERNIGWSRPAAEIWRQVRALAPAPAATALFRNQHIKLLEVQPVEEFSSAAAGEPGTVIESNAKYGLIIATGGGLLQILSLQPAGKRPMSGADFQRGYRVVRGERFQ